MVTTGQPNLAADDNRLMMTPAGWEGISWAAGGFFCGHTWLPTGTGMKKEGECWVVLGFICIFAARFEARLQP